MIHPPRSLEERRRNSTKKAAGSETTQRAVDPGRETIPEHHLLRIHKRQPLRELRYPACCLPSSGMIAVRLSSSLENKSAESTNHPARSVLAGPI